MELIDALDQTFQQTQGVIDNVRPDQLDNPTPCPEWTVRDLMTHAMGVVAGMGAAASGAARPGFELADDPAAQFRDISAATMAAWRTPGVMDKIVDGGPGPMPGHVLAGINLLDTATHTWDLAKATGQSTELDPEVLDAAWALAPRMLTDEIGRASCRERV